MGVHRCASARVCIGRTSWTARTKDFDRYLSLLLGRSARRAVSSAPPSKVTCNATPGLLRSQQTNRSVRRRTRPSAPGVPLDVDSCPLLITTCSIARSGSSCRGRHAVRRYTTAHRFGSFRQLLHFRDGELEREECSRLGHYWRPSRSPSGYPLQNISLWRVYRTAVECSKVRWVFLRRPMGLVDG
jgi:hypothetical protein